MTGHRPSAIGSEALPRILALTDDRVVAEGRVAERAEAMARAAGRQLAVGLRSRALADGALVALAREVAEAVRPHGSWVAISGRADIARGVGARMVLAGRGAMTTADLRRVHPQAVVVRSAHSLEETGAEADALIVGPIFETSSHPDGRPVGAALVAALSARSAPVFAVGGITPERVPDMLAAGAWGVAAISALWDDGRIGDFLKVLPRDESIALTINGEARRARRGLSLATLLADLEIDPRGVVVERNRQIVRRDALAATPVDEGDSLELVHFVGGG